MLTDQVSRARLPAPTPEEVTAKDGSRAYFARVHGRSNDMRGGLIHPFPRVVDVSVSILDVYSVDAQAGTVEVEVSVTSCWTDPALGGAFGESLAGAPQEELAAACWLPGVQIANALSTEELQTAEFAIDFAHVSQHGCAAGEGGGDEVAEDGAAAGGARLRLVQIFRGPIRNAMDLRAFPFDHDEVVVELQSPRYLRHQVLLRPDPCVDHTSTPMRAEHGLLEWSVELPVTVAEVPRCDSVARFAAARGGGGVGGSTNTRRSGGPQPFRSTFMVGFHVWRRPYYFVAKVMLVQVLASVWGWSVLWLDPVAFAEKTSILLTLFLTSVAFLSATNDVLPRVGYLTILDEFTALGFLLQFVLAAETFAVYLINPTDVPGDANGTADGIDKAFRIAMPALYAAGIAALAVRTLALRGAWRSGFEGVEAAVAQSGQGFGGGLAAGRGWRGQGLQGQLQGQHAAGGVVEWRSSGAAASPMPPLLAPPPATETSALKSRGDAVPISSFGVSVARVARNPAFKLGSD